MGSKQFVGDTLFVFQLLCAGGFGLAQAWLMTSTTEGVSITWLSFWGIFLLINLSLALGAHRLQASRITKQTVIVYATWTTFMALNVLVFLWQNAGIWTAIDSWTAGLAGAGIAVTLAIGRRRGLNVSDPLVRGYLAVFFKGLPQLTLAYNILLDGGAGISAVGIIAGHLTIGTRLGQIILSLREAGWDRNRLGSMISEVANEASWLVVTIVWLLV